MSRLRCGQDFSNQVNLMAHRLNKAQLLDLFERTAGQPWVIDTETDGLNVVGPFAPHSAWWIGLSPLGQAEVIILSREEFDCWDIASYLQNIPLIGHNIRFDLHALNLVPCVPFQDTMVHRYFGHTTGRLSLDRFAELFGWDNIPTPIELKTGKISQLPYEKLEAYLENDVILTSKLAYQCKLDHDATRLFDDRVEMAVLRMENRGVRLIEHRLAEVEQLIETSIRSALNVLAEEGFPPNANPQSSIHVAEWLLDNGRKLPLTKGGKPSTNKLALEQLADQGDRLAAAVMHYRKHFKLLTAFVKPLAEHAIDGIVYPRTNTTRTKTGRFSCDTPNLQQIPKRGVIGDALRRCFTSPLNDGIIACDFSQVELRVAAALAQEPVLLEAFANDRCPHTEVAAKMFGKKVEDVHPLERFKAKAVNFGILNGMGAARLSVELRSSVGFARNFLDDYRRNLPQLNSWMNGVWQEADVYRVARTVAGRSRIFGSREETRSAISVIVQGTAAELMRHSLVEVEEAGLQPILSVHDEILTGAASEAKANQVKEAMEHAANNAFPSELGSVRFKAEATTGETWGDA